MVPGSCRGGVGRGQAPAMVARVPRHSDIAKGYCDKVLAKAKKKPNPQFRKDPDPMISKLCPLSYIVR